MRRLQLSLVAFALGSLLAMPRALAEPQPHLRKALKSLEDARAQLQKATADKGGHRAKALELVNEAMAQVKRGIEFDNKR